MHDEDFFFFYLQKEIAQSYSFREQPHDRGSEVSRRVVEM